MAYARYKSHTVKLAAFLEPSHRFTVHFQDGSKMVRTFEANSQASEFMSRMKRNGHFRNRPIKRIDWDRT